VISRHFWTSLVKRSWGITKVAAPKLRGKHRAASRHACWGQASKGGEPAPEPHPDHSELDSPGASAPRPCAAQDGPTRRIEWGPTRRIVRVPTPSCGRLPRQRLGRLVCSSGGGQEDFQDNIATGTIPGPPPRKLRDPERPCLSWRRRVADDDGRFRPRPRRTPPESAVLGNPARNGGVASGAPGVLSLEEGAGAADEGR